MSALPVPRIDEAFPECPAREDAADRRRRFMARLATTLEQSRCSGHRVALFLVGIDRAGIPVGSPEPAALASLTARVDERLARSAGEGFESVRLREDLFALLAPRMGNAAQLREAAARMLGSLRFPFRASIGIALFPTDAVRPSSLLACAAVALSQARREGRHGYRFHVPLHARSG